MSASPHRGYSATSTPPDILQRMIQHLRMHKRDSPETHRQIKQDPSNTSVVASHSASIPTESTRELELETLSRELKAERADKLAIENELTQSQKEHQELKMQFEALKAEVQKHMEQLTLYRGYHESAEKTIAHLTKENQAFASQLGLLCDEHQGQLDEARKEAERIRQKQDRFLALLAALCYNENRRTLLRSTLVSMNVAVELDEDQLEELFHFINFGDNVPSNAGSTTN